MSKKAPLVISLVLIAGCFFQFPRNVDFEGYLNAIKAGTSYPKETAHFGDYFQSPLMTLLLTPFTFLPLKFAKFVWSLINLWGIVYIIRVGIPKAINLKQTVFLFLVLIHGLSDVFIAGNLNFLTLVTCVWGLSEMELPHRKRNWLGGFILAVSLCIKVIPGVCIVWFLFNKKYKNILYTIAGLALCFCLTPSISHWKEWLHATTLYSQAVSYSTESFNAPPNFIFRIFHSASSMPFICTSILFTLLALSLKAQSKAILISAFYLANPFSWASSLLFLFPLLSSSIQKEENSKLAWAGALIYALTPKAFWPADIWIKLIEWNIPAGALLLVSLSSLNTEITSYRPAKNL